MATVPRPARLAWAGLLTLVATLLLLGAAMERDLNHDEHQFLTPGILIAREGLLPYRDFPIFHLPNLAFIYAGLESCTHQLLISAKALNALASAAVAFLLFQVGTTISFPSPLLRRHLLLATAAVVLLLGDQLFVFTAGKTWNHELPAFFLIAAAVCQVQAVQSTCLWWLLPAGLGTGLAIGTRLTYAPTALVFPLMLWAAPLSNRERWRGTALFLGGCLVGLGPSIYFLITAREQFLFDNLRFPRLRLLDVTDTRVHKTAAWWRKVRFFGKEVLLHSLPLLVATIIAAWRPLRVWFVMRRIEEYGVAVAAALLPAALLGCFLPSRYQYQHFYIIAPLLALLLAYATRRQSANGGWNQVTLGVGLCVLASLFPLNSEADQRSGGIKAYTSLALNPRQSFAQRVKLDYAFVSQVKGKILTLAPAPVQSVDGRIYPEFATGPFAWRGARLLSAEERAHYHLVVPEDLTSFLDNDPPAAILTGVEDEVLEQPLVDYARAHQFQAFKVSKKRLYWKPPPSSAP